MKHRFTKGASVALAALLAATTVASLVVTAFAAGDKPGNGQISDGGAEITLELHQGVLGGRFGTDLNAQPGDKMVYIIEARNHTDKTYTGSMSMGLPALVSGRAMELSGGEPDDAGLIRWSEVTLEAGACVCYTVTVELPEDMGDVKSWGAQAVLNYGENHTVHSENVSCVFGTPDLSAGMKSDKNSLNLWVKNGEKATGPAGRIRIQFEYTGKAGKIKDYVGHDVAATEIGGNKAEISVGALSVGGRYDVTFKDHKKFMKPETIEILFDFDGEDAVMEPGVAEADKDNDALWQMPGWLLKGAEK